MSQSNWQPISTAPKDGTKILIVCMSAPIPGIIYAWWNLIYENWNMSDYDGCTETSATHWMPAPALPDKGKVAWSLGELTERMQQLTQEISWIKNAVKRYGLL